MKRISKVGLLVLVLALIATVGAPMALAEGGQTMNAGGLAFFTKFPAQEIAIGESDNFSLTLRADDTPQVVQLSVRDLPDGWTGTFKGKGRIIQAAYVEPGDDTIVEFKVTPPKDVTAGKYHFTLVATGKNGTTELPLDLTIKDKLPPKLEMTTDLPTLKGTPDTTFRYNVTLKNTGDEDLTVNLVGNAPGGINLNFKLSGKDVTSIPVPANETKRITVEAKMYPGTSAGQYPLQVTAEGGVAQASVNLMAVVTGQPKLIVTAPDGRLSADALVNKKNPIKVIVENTGSAPARNIKLTASAPAGWKVEFDPAEIELLNADKQVEVTANIEPSDQAIAGDYMVTIKAKPAESPEKSTDFRITVRTSTLWGIVGIVLIAVAVLGVGLAVARFGRR